MTTGESYCTTRTLCIGIEEVFDEGVRADVRSGEGHCCHILCSLKANSGHRDWQLGLSPLQVCKGVAQDTGETLPGDGVKAGEEIVKGEGGGAAQEEHELPQSKAGSQEQEFNLGIL